MTNNPPKKKLAARIYDAIFPPEKQAHQRDYAAARVSRLNSGWATSPTGANYERRLGLAALIARSRQAARDDLHIVNYLRLMRSNVIGDAGIQLQSRARVRGLDGKLTLDTELNKKVEELWWQWTFAETCTTSGKLDWKGVQDLCVTQCERDGAFLVQMVEADNAFGFSLRTWDVTWLDLTFNEVMPSGNRVIMSVEVDDYDKPVAYWMTTPSSEITYTKQQSRVRTRVPADQIIHGSLIHDDESAVHGVPGTAAALLPCKYALGYNEGVVTQARVAANSFGVLETTAPDGLEQFTGKEDDDGNEQNPMIESSPLSITQLLPGWKLNQFDPKQPTQNHPAFKETLDMDIAAALGVPYFLLMGNWKAVNFSSSRGGLGEFRERCKAYQSFVSTTLCRRVYHKWLEIQFYNQTLKITARQYRELQNPIWQPRGFAYVDPTKDIDAEVTKLQNRLTTPSQVLAEQGIDYLDYLDQWESDKALAAAKGIDIEAVYAVQQKQAGPALAEPDAAEADPPPNQPTRGYLNGHDHDELMN